MKPVEAAIIMLNKFSLLLFTLVSLNGCGSDSSSSESETPTQEIETPAPEVETPTPDIETPVEPEDENTTSSPPNILLIISDDQGLDASAQYNFSDDLPNTPSLNEIAEQGLTFDNMWVTPACSTTRSTILTGKYGVNSGVESLPADLSTEHEVLQQYLANNVASENYKSAVFGKWHLSNASNLSHP